MPSLEPDVMSPIVAILPEGSHIRKQDARLQTICLCYGCQDFCWRKQQQEQTSHSAFGDLEAKLEHGPETSRHREHPLCNVTIKMLTSLRSLSFLHNTLP